MREGAATGTSLYVDMVALECVESLQDALALQAPEPVFQSKGGLYCDEPGLGKTVTGECLRWIATLTTPRDFALSSSNTSSRAMRSFV